MEIRHMFDGSLGNAPPRLLANGGDGRRDVFHVTFDPIEDDVVEEIVRSVAIIHNVEADDLPPVAGTVDPDALSTIVGVSAGASGPAAQVTFLYQGLEITVTAEGDLWLEWV